ncbi:hypothetical protein H0H81_012716 [Sphagnurus paluster]|uniref:G-alpha-domain-containing protein n=1 Tax=Sphagnurus paluster TaxID=117069 RepID=A0A9P7GGN8_9AGAR|nr:hypothetical protein H0H81_012716 [Sphagnurus paluster]
MGGTDPDPFAIFTLPPPNETPEQRSAREHREAEEKRVSDRIDEEIKAEKAALKKQKGVVRVLLLGQSESGACPVFGPSSVLAEFHYDCVLISHCRKIDDAEECVLYPSPSRVRSPTDDDIDHAHADFRMKYARAAWKAERLSWRAVIQLNLIRSIITIVETLQAEFALQSQSQSADSSPTASPRPSSYAYPYPYPYPYPHAPIDIDADLDPTRDSVDSDLPPMSIPIPTPSPSPTPTPSTARTHTSPLLTPTHLLLQRRLGPLRRVEADLKRRLGAGSSDECVAAAEGMGILGELAQAQAAAGAGAGAGDQGGDDALGLGLGLGCMGMVGMGSGARTPEREFGVRGWRYVVEGPLAVLNPNIDSNTNANANGKDSSNNRKGTGGSRDGHAHGSGNGSGKRGGILGDDGKVGIPDLDEATEVIVSCREDMKALWEDSVVRAVLRRRGVRMEDEAGFFLNDLDRIARRTYEPTDDDIVRARLRTLGIQEYRIRFDGGGAGGFLESAALTGDFGHEWILYDVGGSRTARNAWLPYFEAVNAIIFPISCFDERLREDPSVNRLEDSFLLWRTICASPILAKSTIILFLNKCDLLKRKLRSGAMVKKYLPSFGERANELGVVVKYLKEKFKDILKQQSPEPRVSYFYATSVTDTKSTATTLRTVRDSILREHLKSADFV